MTKFPCSLCGSRNWPNTWTACPLCRADDDTEVDQDIEEEETNNDD